MTKPHEETWGVTEHGRVSIAGEPGKGGREILCDAYTATPDLARARLAAQAPAMARLLLAVEWAGSGEEGARCPSCLADAYVPPVIYDADGKYVSFTPGKHDGDCELAAVLRAAGVMP